MGARRKKGITTPKDILKKCQAKGCGHVGPLGHDIAILYDPDYGGHFNVCLKCRKRRQDENKSAL